MPNIESLSPNRIELIPLVVNEYEHAKDTIANRNL